MVVKMSSSNQFFMPQKDTKKHTPESTLTAASRWKIGEVELVREAFVFNLSKRRMTAPSGYTGDFYFLESGDWVNVFPITAAGELVLIKQYRPNVQEYFLEVPGGMLDKTDLDPKLGALRELREETGYTSNRCESLGPISPNPAIHNNLCHLYVAFDCEKTASQDLDPGEDIEIVKIPLADAPQLIRSGALTHSLMVAAFLKLFIRLGTLS